MEKTSPSLERTKLIKWVTRFHDRNLSIFKDIFIRIERIALSFGYSLVEIGRDGTPAQVNSLMFNKIIDDVNYRDIYILFDKYGKLQFSVTFGSYVLKDERTPIVMAWFVKRQSELWSAKLWGARWYHFDKKRRFLADWRKFEETVPHIVRFLEEGEPHPNIYVGYRRPDLP